MKRAISALLFFVLCLSLMSCALADGVKDDYNVSITSNYWYHYTALGDNLYVPYLKVEVKNKQSTPASKIVVKAVFYNENKKEVWDETTDYLVSSSDTPLRSGYSKTSFIKSSVGYKQQISSLPDITVEIYINGEYYGIVEVLKTYEENKVSITPADSLEAIREAEKKAKEAEKKAEQEKEASMTDKERIDNQCTESTVKQIENRCSSVNKAMSSLKAKAQEKVNNDIKYSESTGKFACVSTGSYTARSPATGNPLKIECIYGITGHMDGKNVEIDKMIEIDREDSSAISKFWKENWK